MKLLTQGGEKQQVKSFYELLQTASIIAQDNLSRCLKSHCVILLLPPTTIFIYIQQFFPKTRKVLVNVSGFKCSIEFKKIQ